MIKADTQTALHSGTASTYAGLGCYNVRRKIPNKCWARDDLQRSLRSCCRKSVLKKWGTSWSHFAMAWKNTGLLITRWGFRSRRSSKVSHRVSESVATDMKIVSSNGEAVLSRCIDLVSSDDENHEEAEVDPMLGQSGPSTGKQRGAA